MRPGKAKARRRQQAVYDRGRNMPEEKLGSTASPLRWNAEHVIDASKPWHLADWSAIVGLPENTLGEAVDAAGHDVDAVLPHLARTQRVVNCGTGPPAREG